MRSLLTYYDKKLHLKTVWNEGYEAAQEEITELKSTLQDKIAEIAKVDAEIEELNRQLVEAKK